MKFIFLNSLRETLVRYAKRIAVVEDDEVEPLLNGFFSYFCCLSSYFVLQPLRDDTAVILGTKTLPVLFVASLLVTMAVSPTASAYIARSTKRRSGSAVRTVYRCMALVTTGLGPRDAQSPLGPAGLALRDARQTPPFPNACLMCEGGRCMGSCK
uniref:Uncharacterized protein n=2 Tax=Tetraselmis sp. GSL018 TaxID=582737 RepID=A0A061SIW6_9CHLO